MMVLLKVLVSILCFFPKYNIMLNCDIVRHLKSWRGDVYVPVTGAHGHLYVKVVKSDIMASLSSDPNSDIGLMFSITNINIAYVDRDYNIT